MKKLKAILHSWETRIEGRWQQLSAKKQRKFVVLFFVGYLLITGCVIVGVWYDSKSTAQTQENGTSHIRNPILKHEKQLGDSSSIISKNQSYDRK